MNKQILTLAATCALASPLLAAPPLYDQNVTPDAIFGGGNANGSYTVDRSNGVELGLRAKLRYPVPANIFNSNGDGTYTFKSGWGGVGDPLNPKWHFEWSVNSDWDGSSPFFLDDLTYEIGMDYDSGPDAFYETFDQITPVAPPFWWDHSIGTNATGNGAGAEAPFLDSADYILKLANNNVAQNSWRPTFYDNYYFTFNPADVGRYEYYVSAFDNLGRVAHTGITIFSLDHVTLTLDGDGCQGVDQDLITPGHQIKVTLNIRNPDSVPITGYQAFVKFNAGTMTYVGATSSYSASPFSLHLQPIGTANVDLGELRLDGSVGFGSPAITGGANAATLYFTVAGGGCGNHFVEFDLDETFDSEVSNLGVPYATDLLDSPTIKTDSTPPTISVQPSLVVHAEPGVCSADIFPQKFPFNTDPDLSPTQTPGDFYTDRYPPFLFESAYFDGDFRLHHQVNVADSAANRPPAYSSTFYNTQGRKLDINSGLGSSVSVDLYIGSDWASNDRRADLWLTTFDANNQVSGFPILGYARIAGGPFAAGAFRVFTQDTDQNPGNGYTADWVSLGLPGGFAFDKWYTLRTTLLGSGYLFEVLDNGVPVLSYTDAITEGSVLIGNTIIQAYNFGSTYDVYWDNLQIAGQYPTVSDGCGGLPNVVGTRSDNQPLTAPFPANATTTITWTATDECGNESTANQAVTVLDTVLVNVTVQLQGSGAATRCIHFVPNDCDSDVTALVDFTGAPGTGVASIEVPCGTWTNLCAKDEQHTQWASTGLTNMGTHYEANSLLVLKAGDTDNDGDVDINDVTLFLAQYGTSPATGGCPWDGTRSADFSNSGSVLAEDYSALTPNWLTTSACICSMPSTGGDERLAHWIHVHDVMSKRADLDGNGRVDVRDVEILEKRFNLSGSLSKRMRDSERGH